MATASPGEGGGSHHDNQDNTEPTNSGGTSSGEQAAHDGHGVSRKGQPWSEDEHLSFLAGLKKLGKGNWRGISRLFVPTRTATQVASHAQKHFMRVAGATKRKSRFTALEAQVMGAAVSPSRGTAHSSGSSGQQQHQQATASAQQQHQQQLQLQQQQHQLAAASAAFPSLAALPGLFPMVHMMNPMMFGFPGAPFLPPFMCPPPAFAAAAALSAAAMQKQGMPMMPMFPMAAFQSMPAYAMMAQAAAAAAAAAQQQQHMYDDDPCDEDDDDEAGNEGLQSADGTEDERTTPEPAVAGAGRSPQLQQQHRLQLYGLHHVPEVEPEATGQRRRHQLEIAALDRSLPRNGCAALPAAAAAGPSSSSSQPGGSRGSPPASPGRVVCLKPEATHARRASPEDHQALLHMLPTTTEVQVAFHASSHSAFRPPQEIRAEG